MFVMEIAERQNRIIKALLSVNSLEVLNRIEVILQDSETVAYDAKGTPLTKSEYIKSIDDAINETDEVSTDEVFKNIKNAYGLE